MDGLYIYNRFDGWTRQTGILDGGGLTWVVRLPLNVVVVVVSLLCGLFINATHEREEVHDANR